MSDEYDDDCNDDANGDGYDDGNGDGHHNVIVELWLIGNVMK